MASGVPARVETIVIGGGQAGVSVGYYLTQRGLPFVILDANERLGDAWRNRWDSLRLFTPRRFDGLAGTPFPGPSDSFPTKDEVGDYLEAFAARFELLVRTGVRVRGLTKNEEGFVVTTRDRRIESHNVVVAMGTHQIPWVPLYAAELGPDVVQMHSVDYRNPSQLQEGGVLVVGVGNSGGENALEVANSHPTWLAGKEVGHVPFRIDGALARFVVLPLLFRVIAQRVLTVDTRIGRRIRPALLSRGSPLVRVRPKDLAAAGVERLSRIAGVRDGFPVTEDDEVLSTRSDFSWIDLPVFGETEPRHYRGIVAEEPGLYFVGLHFLYAMSSGFLPGVGRDAEYVVEHIASRAR